MLGEVESGGAGELLARFLGGRSASTRRAYTLDIADFARFRDRSPAEAVAELLTSSQQGKRIVLDYVVDMHRRGLSPATSRRRIVTLRTLVQMAVDRGAADWSVETPSEEDVAAEERARAGQGAYAAYFLPHSAATIHRLDVNHYALRSALGADYLAPVDRPARILDVGSGTGQWAYDLCAEFPQALAVGFDLDLEVGKRPWPAAYHFVQGNALQGLPFASDHFDFVHGRGLALTMGSWESVTEEMVRVTRPGGWIEMVESLWRFNSEGPATARLCGLAKRLVRAQGMDASGTVADSLDEYLSEAGAADIRRREVDLPVGEWGGDLGSLMASGTRALFIRLAPFIAATFDIAQCECLELIQTMQQEWEERHATTRFVIAFGRKPG
jgi:SAM-dependent methyltransferase